MTKPTDLDIAIERLTAWVRDYGDAKPKEFIGDVSLLLLAARECRSARDECERLTGLLRKVIDGDWCVTDLQEAIGDV